MSASTLEPPKFIKDSQNIRRKNLAWVQWKKQQHYAAASNNNNNAFAPGANYLAPNATNNNNNNNGLTAAPIQNPQHHMANEATALPVISGMNELNLLGDGATADSTYTKAVEDYRATAQSLGLSGDEAVDGLTKYFAAHEVPMGMINKLFILQTFDHMVFMSDDSYSMDSTDDTLCSGSPVSRFQQMKSRYYELLEICSFVKTPSISIYWLNNPKVYTLDRIDGEKPVDFQKRAKEFLNRAFEKSTCGSTPMLELVTKVFNKFKGKSVWYGLACDGQPNNKAVTVPQIRRMIRERPEPERNPITFMSMTDEDDDVEWMKQCESVAPFAAECDDYKTEEQECLSAQGKAFSFSYGLYLLCHLVGASDPDALDALDEHPLTKASLSAIQGYSLSDQEFDYYFDGVMEAQHKLAADLTMSSETEDFIKYHYMLKFNACRDEFKNTAKVNDIPAIKEYKAKLANVKNESKRQHYDQVMTTINRQRELKRRQQEIANQLNALPRTEEINRRAIAREEQNNFSAIHKKFLNSGPGSGCCSIQ